MTNLNPIIKTSLADKVAGELRQQIQNGVLKPHEKLPVENELAVKFGVGRSSIREAIKTLANNGLLRVQQGVGTFVEAPSGIKEPLTQRLKRAKSVELDEVRQLLEMKIAEKAAINRTAADIKKMQLHLAQRKAAATDGDLHACVEADILFHTAIAEAANNEILCDLYKTLAIHLKHYFIETMESTADFMATEKLHEQLLKNISDGDAKKAWRSVAKITGHISQ